MWLFSALFHLLSVPRCPLITISLLLTLLVLRFQFRLIFFLGFLLWAHSFILSDSIRLSLSLFLSPFCLG